MYFDSYEKITQNAELRRKLEEIVGGVYSYSAKYEIDYAYNKIKELMSYHSSYGIFIEYAEKLYYKLGSVSANKTLNILKHISERTYNCSSSCVDLLDKVVNSNYDVIDSYVFSILKNTAGHSLSYQVDKILKILDARIHGNQRDILEILQEISRKSMFHSEKRKVLDFTYKVIEQYNQNCCPAAAYNIFRNILSKESSKSVYSEEILDKIMSYDKAKLSSNAAKEELEILLLIARTYPDLSLKVFEETKQLLNSDVKEYGSFYKIFSQTLQRYPELSGEIMSNMQNMLPSVNDADSLVFAYWAYDQILSVSPELSDKVATDIAYCLSTGKNYNDDLKNLCFKIMATDPDFAGKVLQEINDNITSREKETIPLYTFKFTSDIMHFIATNNLLPIDKVLDTADVIIATDINNDNQLEICPCLVELSKVENAPIERIFKQLEVSIIKSNEFFEDKDWSILAKGYMAIADILKYNPSCADKFLENMDEKIADNSTGMYEIISTIYDLRPDLIPVLEEKFPDVNLKVLAVSAKMSKLFEGSLCADIYSSKYQTLSELSDTQLKRLNLILTTKQLDKDSKKVLCYMFKENQLPIKDVLEFNPSAYKEILDYMLLQESKANPKLTKEQIYTQNKEWMVKSSICVAVLYKKDYKRYFDVIEKYNTQLPKLKSTMPQVYQEADEKEAKLRAELKPIQKERSQLSAKRNRRLMTLKQRQANRLRYEELGVVEQGIKGHLRGVVGYIDYNHLQPIGMEKATAWMQEALMVSDREGLLKKINSSILGTNPNILACGRNGQPFIRLEHQVPVTNNNGSRVVSKNIDELILVSSRWDLLLPEVKAKGFKEIVDVAQAYKFNGDSIEFMEANGKYISNQKIYDEAEAIYVRGKLTPSRFERKEHYSSDGKWRCYIADKDDPRPLYAGGNWSDRAKCCQSYGSAGSTCAIDSVLNPDSGCVIFERKTKVKDEFGTEQEVWEMQGCSWCYEVQSGEYKKLIFDNVEINNGYKYELKSVNEVFDAMVADLGKDNYSEIRMGYSPDLGERKDSKAVKNEALPHGYSGYSDASTQYVLLKNPTATPEQLPEVMIVGMDLEKHKAGMSKVAAKAFPDGSQHLEIPKDAKGIVLVNRSNEVLGYVIWTEKSRETHEEKPVKNWITDMAVSPEYRGKTGFKLLTEMMKHVQKTGGTWGAELRDSTSFKYIMTMSDKVKNGEIAGVDSDFRGRAKVDLEVVELAYVMSKDSKTGESSKVYRCVFTPLTEEETKARLQARKIEEREIQARGKIEEKHSQQSQQLQQDQTDVKEVLPSIISQAVTGTTKEVR